MLWWEAHDTRKRYRELKRKHPHAVILLESGDDIFLTYYDSAEYLKKEYEKQYYINAKNEAGLSIPRDWLTGRLERIDAYAWVFKETACEPQKVKQPKHIKINAFVRKPRPTDQEPVCSCDNCQLRKSGACSQLRNELCGDYRAIPFIPIEVKDSWPEFGDATAFRLGEKRNW